MFDLGRVCMKIAGRDGNNIAVVIKKLDDNHVLIDGNVRRKKCSVKHLEPLDKILQIKEEESGEKIRELLKKEGFKVIKKGEKREKKSQQKVETKKVEISEEKLKKTKK